MSDKNINIDDLFRDAFENFEVDPPEHVWENIQKNMHGNGKGGSGKSFPKGGILGISTIFILSSLFFLFSTDNISSNSEKIALNSDINNIETLLAVNNSNNNALQNTPHTPEQSFIDKGYVNVSPSTKNSGIESLDKRGNDAMIAVSTVNEDNIHGSVTANQVGSPDYNNNPTNFKEQKNQVSDDSDLLAMGSSNNINSTIKASAPIPEESYEISPPVEMIEKNEKQTSGSESGTGPEIKSDYGKRGDIYFGLYFTPEVIFYPSDNNLTNKSYSLDLNATYKFSNYLLQSGIGIMSSTDNGQSKVDFKEYLGSYEDVYDITFDTTSGVPVPTYHTETVDVYDSIQHVTVTPTKNKYTYLQIPVLFGYGEELRRFSWFVKGGPSLSIMINENKSSVNLDNDNNRVINVDSEIPSRIKTNWQILLSAGVTYKLGNHVSIGVEPLVRFYMKSAYDQNTLKTKHPYSFGIRSGIIVNF